MQSTYEQLRALPSLKLVLYLVGLFGVLLSLSYIHAIKPAFAKTKELQAEHQQLTRLVSKFDIGKLDSEVAGIKQQQDQARLRLSAEVPDRKLDQELPTILESLHETAKSHGLRTRKIQPAKVERNSDVATVELEIEVVGAYRNLFTWVSNFSNDFKGVSVQDIRATQSPDTNSNRTLAMNLVIYGR